MVLESAEKRTSGLKCVTASLFPYNYATRMLHVFISTIILTPHENKHPFCLLVVKCLISFPFPILVACSPLEVQHPSSSTPVSSTVVLSAPHFYFYLVVFAALLLNFDLPRFCMPLLKFRGIPLRNIHCRVNHVRCTTAFALLILLLLMSTITMMVHSMLTFCKQAVLYPCCVHFCTW